MSGPKDELQAFFAKARGRTVNRKESFQFNNFLPVPSDIPALEKALEGTTWGAFAERDSGGEEELSRRRSSLQHYWRIQCWGTKWEPDVYRYRYPSPTVRSVEFFTAWGPPVNFLLEASKSWPSLSFLLRYAEPGADFAGECKVANSLEEFHDEGDVDAYKFARDWYPSEPY